MLMLFLCPLDAYAYYIRCCLHNWTDPLVLKILEATVPAVARDSRFPIGEMLVPNSLCGVNEGESGRHDGLLGGSCHLDIGRQRANS